MSATERLRAMLDERGVEWWPMHDIENGYREDRDTEFLVYGCKHVAHEWGCRLQVDMLTPEQAIEATLGDTDATGERQGDAVQVVRCRDCKWCMAYSKATHCDRFAHELPTVEPDGFCAWGRRADG